MRGYTDQTFGEYTVLRQNLATLGMLAELGPHHLTELSVKLEFDRTLSDVLSTIRKINEAACRDVEPQENPPPGGNDQFFRKLLGD